MDVTQFKRENILVESLLLQESFQWLEIGPTTGKKDMKSQGCPEEPLLNIQGYTMKKTECILSV